MIADCCQVVWKFANIFPLSRSISFLESEQIIQEPVLENYKHSQFVNVFMLFRHFPETSFQNLLCTDILISCFWSAGGSHRGMIACLYPSPGCRLEIYLLLGPYRNCWCLSWTGWTARPRWPPVAEEHSADPQSTLLALGHYVSWMLRTCRILQKLFFKACPL